jgi:hypothetical protein
MSIALRGGCNFANGSGSRDGTGLALYELDVITLLEEIDMFSMKTLAAVAIVGAVVTPAAANDRAQSNFNTRSAIPAVPDDAQASPSDRLEGQVLAVDVSKGRMLVATDIGMIAYAQSPPILPRSRSETSSKWS